MVYPLVSAIFSYPCTWKIHNFKWLCNFSAQHLCAQADLNLCCQIGLSTAIW